MTSQIENNTQVTTGRHYQSIVDIKESIKLWRLACSLGWFDVKLRYKGSIIGPLWMILTPAIMIATMGIIYSSLFKMELQRYLPFLAVSIILWQNVIAITITDACQCFLQANDTIRSIKLPFFLQALRTIIRNAIILAHNIIVPLVVFIIFNVWPGWVALLSIPGFLLWIFDGLAICLLLGCVCARYRDITQIVNSLIQIIFYVTPIIWLPTQLKQHVAWLVFNPFYPIIEIVRSPLLGQTPSHTIWIYAIFYSVILWIAAWFTFARSRARLAFWI